MATGREYPIETRNVPAYACVWKVKGMESHGSSAGDFTIFVLTGSPTELPDAEKALNDMTTGRVEVHEIYSIECVSDYHGDFQRETHPDLISIHGCHNQTGSPLDSIDVKSLVNALLWEKQERKNSLQNRIIAREQKHGAAQ